MTGALRIPLNQGRETIISSEDEHLFGPRKWFVSSPNPGKFYVMRAPSRGKTEYLHRLILNAQPGQIVDHINGDGLDNRRENLRLADATLNCANRRDHKPASGFRGVYASRRRWYAEIFARRKKYYLGHFTDPVEAALAYDAAAKAHFGDFAVLNFPDREAA